MSERSVFDELMPTKRDVVVAAIGAALYAYTAPRFKQYLDKREMERIERIAHYIRENQSKQEFSSDISKLYESIDNLTKKFTEFEKRSGT